MTQVELAALEKRATNVKSIELVRYSFLTLTVLIVSIYNNHRESHTKYTHCVPMMIDTPFKTHSMQKYYSYIIL